MELLSIDTYNVFSLHMYIHTYKEISHKRLYFNITIFVSQIHL